MPEKSTPQLLYQLTTTDSLFLLLAAAGIGFSKSWSVKRIQQKTFDSLLLAFTAIAALRLVGLF